MGNCVKRGNMRNVLDFQLDVQVLHVGPGTTKEDLEKFSGRPVIAIPQEDCFFIKDLGVPIVRWSYVMKTGRSLHVSTEEELKHTIPYIVHQFKKTGGERMVDDFKIPDEPALSEEEAEDIYNGHNLDSFTYSPEMDIQ